MKLSLSRKTALVFLCAVVAYFAVHAVIPKKAEETAADLEPTLFRVITNTVEPQPWQAQIAVRGRTEALRKVVVRAETVGAVADTPVERGAKVKQGDVLCRLNVDARRAALNEAKASLAKAKLDYQAAVKLAADGFRAETAVASQKAALDLAKANEEQARLNLTRTNIVAPFDGIFDDRLVEIGDFLSVGDPCGVVIQLSPFLVTGAVSERDVSKIRPGDRGDARLSTGQIIEGKVRFVASSSDPATRTFDIELEIPNEDGALKDGVTADFTIFAARRQAHLAPHSALTLDDKGALAVRVVKEVNGEDIVETKPVQIIGENENGAWLEGLSGAASIITRGQEYVSHGQKVIVASSKAATAESTP